MKKGISLYWLGETLREYNWGVTTNYSSIYTSVHVMCSQVSVSYIKYMCLQYCATMHSDACIGHALDVCTICVLEPYNIVYRAKHQNDPR